MLYDDASQRPRRAAQGAKRWSMRRMLSFVLIVSGVAWLLIGLLIRFMLR
jgi:hypothetical protein